MFIIRLPPSTDGLTRPELLHNTVILGLTRFLNYKHGTLSQISEFKLLHNYSDVLTVTGWITACPRPIINILAGTRAISAQYVASITNVDENCAYEVWSSWWLVAHHTICDGQIWTSINYSEEREEGSTPINKIA